MAMTSLLLLQLSLLLPTFFTTSVFAVDENIVSWVALPPHHHGGYHSLTPSLAPAPTPHHHHHHHHAYPPASTPTPVPAHPPTHHHHHGHPPSKAPVHSPPPAHPPKASHPPPPAHPPKSSHPPPPAHPPKSSYPPPPAHPPVLPPHLPPTYPPKRSYPFPRKLVAVQGVVFLKSCKYVGSDTLNKATPLYGATVKLQCNNTAKPLTATAVTDKNGYFLLPAPKMVTNYAVHKCKVSLVPTKLPLVKQPSDLHGGVSGAMLNVDKKKPSVTVNGVEYALFTVGPFAYEPKCPH